VWYSGTLAPAEGTRAANTCVRGVVCVAFSIILHLGQVSSGGYQRLGPVWSQLAGLAGLAGPLLHHSQLRMHTTVGA
jgi:hypothetical protein